MNRKKPVTRSCEFCLRKFEVMPHTLRDNSKIQRRAVYCSQTCKGRATRALQLGLSFEQAKMKWVDKLRPLPFCKKEKLFS